MNKGKNTNGNSRRTFLFGLVTGAGVAAAASVAASPKPARAKTAKSPKRTGGGPVLYRRTAETERYYKTLYL